MPDWAKRFAVQHSARFQVVGDDEPKPSSASSASRVPAEPGPAQTSPRSSAATLLSDSSHSSIDWQGGIRSDGHDRTDAEDEDAGVNMGPPRTVALPGEVPEPPPSPREIRRVRVIDNGECLDVTQL